MRSALLLAILLSGCAATGAPINPESPCYALTASPDADDAGWFERLPAIIQLTREPLPEIDAARADGPAVYRRARSWPADWDGTTDTQQFDPIGGWRSGAWYLADGVWTYGRPSPSRIIDVGPYAVAFAGWSFRVSQSTAYTLRGTVTSFTDSSTDGRGFEREAPVEGDAVRCPARPAYAERTADARG